MPSIDAHTVGTDPRKALVLTLLALIGTTGLAGALVWHRRTVSLGEEITPEGWRISFTPPGRWVQLPAERIDGNTLVFESPDGGGVRRLLIVSRDPQPQEATPERIAKRFLRELRYPGLRGLVVRSFDAHPVSFGPFPGATIADVQNGTIVSAALGDGDAYCVARVMDRPLAGGDHALVRQLVESVEYGQRLIR